MASNPVITVPILELWAKRVNDAITKEQWFPTYLPPCNSTFQGFLKQKTHSKQYGVMDVMHAVKNVLLLGLIACTAYRCGLLGHMSLVAWPNRLHVAHTDLPCKNGWTDRDAVGGGADSWGASGYSDNRGSDIIGVFGARGQKQLSASISYFSRHDSEKFLRWS